MVDRTEYALWKVLDLDIAAVVLASDQGLWWFSGLEARPRPLAFEFNPMVDAFFGNVRHFSAADRISLLPHDTALFNGNLANLQ